MGVSVLYIIFLGAAIKEKKSSEMRSSDVRVFMDPIFMTGGNYFKPTCNIFLQRLLHMYMHDLMNQKSSLAFLIKMSASEMLESLISSVCEIRRHNRIY